MTLPYQRIHCSQEVFIHYSGQEYRFRYTIELARKRAVTELITKLGCETVAIM